MTENFELFASKYGGGWAGVHVKLKEWYRPPGFDGCDGLICLTLESETPDELERDIDGLISQLQSLRRSVRRDFDRIAKKAA
jgi:hypothetical protein